MSNAIQPTLADFAGKAILDEARRRVRTGFIVNSCAVSIRIARRIRSRHAPSSANPNERIQRAAMMAKDPVSDQTYRQEWLAEFIEHEGTVFRNIDACSHSPV